MKNQKKIKIIATLCVIAWFALFGKHGIFTQNSDDKNRGSTERKAAEETTIEKSVLEIAEFERVVDGDTIQVLYNGKSEKVRLTGVNCPESVSPDQERNNEYGVYASDFTKDRFKKADTIWLQFDKEKTDSYDRLLAYVWTNDEVDVNNVDNIRKFMYNAVLLDAGMAHAVVYEPNHAYKDVFEKIQMDAENSEAGLWKYEKFKNE